MTFEDILGHDTDLKSRHRMKVLSIKQDRNYDDTEVKEWSCQQIKIAVSRHSFGQNQKYPKHRTWSICC